MSAYCDFHDSNNSRCSLNVPGNTGYCMVWKGECPYEDARRKAAEMTALANEMVSQCTDGASVGTIRRYAERLRQLSAEERR